MYHSPHELLFSEPSNTLRRLLMSVLSPSRLVINVMPPVARVPAQVFAKLLMYSGISEILEQYEADLHSNLKLTILPQGKPVQWQGQCVQSVC